MGMKGPVGSGQIFNYHYTFRRCVLGALSARRPIGVALTLTMVRYMTIREHLRLTKNLHMVTNYLNHFVSYMCMVINRYIN